MESGTPVLLPAASEAVPSRLAVVLGWAVHLYTASGAFLGLLALRAVVDADPRRAFGWMLAATVVDSTDGWLARKLEVRRTVPRIDGRRLDDVVDYFTYVIVPVALLSWLDLLPRDRWILAFPLVASGLGFANEQAKTDDDYFLGFPSYWNVVALYLWLFQCRPWTNAAIVIVLSVMILVPTRYIYPSKTKPLQHFTVVFCAVWGIQLFWAFVFPEWTPGWWLWSSLVFPAYYLIASFALHFLTASAPARPPANRDPTSALAGSRVRPT